MSDVTTLTQTIDTIVPALTRAHQIYQITGLTILYHVRKPVSNAYRIKESMTKFKLDISSVRTKPFQVNDKALTSLHLYDWFAKDRIGSQ